MADEYVPKFSRAFLDAMKGLLDEKAPKDFREAWESRSLVRMIDSLPLFAEGSTDQLKVWERFSSRMESAYSGLMEEASTEARREAVRDLKLPKDVIRKEAPEPDPEVESTPPFVNPYVAPWIDERLRRLASHTLTDKQIEAITGIVTDAFDRGLRAEEVYQEIRANIGLLPRDIQAIFSRRALLLENGVPIDKTDELVDKYRNSKYKERAARIARTETIAAHAAARSTTWQAMKDAGDLPDEVKRVWASAPASPNPLRPCPVCYNLDGEEAAIGEPYQSINGPIMHPPDSHPN